MRGFLNYLKLFPGAFWAANTMEIFERMGWYGFYAVSTLYLTGAVEDGGLGFTSEERGVIQGVVTFFLYMFPAVFGALADRYGFKTMFMASFIAMVPAYILLSRPTTFLGFLLVYLFVAVGHGMFKPVVISTVVKTTTEKTGSMGMGIFYMMVNIGGFLGPIIAGVVRGWDWKYVFYASALWIALNLVVCFIFYREPGEPLPPEERRSLPATLAGMVKLVGSPQFFMLVATVLILLVLGSKWIAFGDVALASLAIIGLNIALHVALRLMGQGRAESPWPLQGLRIGEGRYLLFLLLMAGFWTSFNQIFMTLPEYIRDYSDTSDLVGAFSGVAQSIAGFFSALGFDTSEWHKGILDGGQVKPEFLINLNAFGIILFQVVISYFSRNLKPFTTIISGVLITVVSFLAYLIAQTGWIIVIGVLVFSVGEMFASPKSKEYAGRIAPPNKIGMYMGYFYWCVALGNLFGGLLSGVMYQHYGPQGVDDPDTMWVIFALLALVTAGLLAMYNAWVRRQQHEEEAAE